MATRPRRRTLSAATVGAAQELGELNPLEKARAAIAGETAGGAPKARPDPIPKTKKPSPQPSRGASGGSARSGFAGRRADSPSKRKIRRRGAGVRKRGR